MTDQPQHPRRGITRRAALALGGGAAVGLTGIHFARRAMERPAPVFIARSQRYDGPLAATIREGLAACGLAPAQFRGRRVLLKPNLVEPSRLVPHMTTHPAVVVAAAQVFRDWGAHVSVGEAPGHLRDTQQALEDSGVGAALADSGFPFADLNYEESAWRHNRGRFSPLKGLYFPRSVLEAAFIVSMPKLKTHHWVGMTAAMKNFYGVLPGLKYGWPKNVLHHNGIPQTVVDINCTLPRTLAIVDAIDCMEGDGPILGSAKSLGVLLVGTSLPAVDATAARIMGLEPSRISYLEMAAQRLGPIEDRLIDQRGERWQSVASPFKLIAEPHIQELRADRHGALFS